MIVKRDNLLVLLGLMNVVSFILAWFAGVYFFMFLITAVAIVFTLDEKALEDRQTDSQLKRLKERQTETEVQIARLQEDLKRTQTTVNMSGMLRK